MQKRPNVVVEINSVGKKRIETVWTELSEVIERGLSTGQGDGTTSGHMKAAIIRGDMLMWVILDGGSIVSCLVLSVRKTDTMTKLFIELLAGKDMNLWADEIEQLLLEFKDLTGAICIEASCRLGLARYLQKRGWRKKSVIMELK